MIIVYMLGLMLSSSLSAFVYPVAGENLWRMVSRIGFTVDVIESNVDIIGSLVETMVSKTEALDTDLRSVSDILSSQLDDISKDISALDASLGSLIEDLDQSLLSISDTMTSQLDALTSSVQSTSDSLISQLDVIDTNITSLQETTISTIDTATQIIVSTIDTLEECLVGVPITTVPFVISAPGVYHVCKNLTLNSGILPLIEIASSDVTLDLGGHTLTTGTSNYGVAIIIGGPLRNIQIRNGMFEIGSTSDHEAIIVQAASNVVIEDVLVQNGPDVCLSIGSDCHGITLCRCICIGTNGNTISGAPSATGAFYVDGLYGNALGVTDSIIMQNCSASNGVGRGFSCNNCASVLVNAMHVFNAASAGFRVDALASTVECVGCSAINSCVGFNILNNNAVVSHCIATSSIVAGFTTDSASTATVFVECEACNDNNIGFDIAGDNNLLKRCVVANNSVGIAVELSATNTQIIDTCPVNNTTNFINSGSNTTFINLGTVFESLKSAIDTIKPCCSALDRLDIAVTSLSDALQKSASSIASSVENLAPCLVHVAITQSMMPYTISAPGVYTLCENVTTGGAPAITISASNVTLDLNEHTIININNRGIVCNGQTNVTIKQGVILSALEAISVNTVAQDIVLSDIQVINSARTAISIQNSRGVTLNSCRCHGTNGTIIHVLTDGAFYIVNSGDVTIQACTVDGGTLLSTGFYVQDPIGAISVTNTSVADALYGFSVIYTLVGTPFDVTFRNCIAENCTLNSGFNVIGASILPPYAVGPLFESCIAQNNQYGFRVQNMDQVVMRNCIARGNLVAGFNVNTTINNAIYNSISQSNNQGFVVNASTNCTFRQCSAIANTVEGFAIDLTSSFVVIDEGLASRNATGIVNAGTSVTIVDTRSSHAATTVNPAYNLNTLPDVVGLATVVITS